MLNQIKQNDRKHKKIQKKCKKEKKTGIKF